MFKFLFYSTKDLIWVLDDTNYRIYNISLYFIECDFKSHKIDSTRKIWIQNGVGNYDFELGTLDIKRKIS